MVRLFASQFPLNHQATPDQMLGVVKNWIASGTYSKLSLDDIIDLKNHGDTTEVQGSSLKLYRHSNDIMESVGLKYVLPGPRDKNWITEIVGTRTPEDFWVRVTVDHDSAYADARREKVNKPLIIGFLMKELGGGIDSCIALQSDPHKLTRETNADKLFVSSFMNGETSNFLPIIYVSKTNHNEYIVDPTEISIELRGLAHIFL